MRIFSTSILLFFFSFNLVYSQESVIKKIIYDDLYTLNNIYDGCVIQFKQEKQIIKENDTIMYKKTVDTLKDSSDSRVLIVRIDSTISGFFFVKAKFDLLSGFSHIDLFENTFEYVLYKSESKYYKVNGFLISDIFSINESAKRIKTGAKINAPTFMFVKHFRKRNSDKISKYLFVSVLHKLNNYGYMFYYRPYVKDLVCKAGF